MATIFKTDTGNYKALVRKTGWWKRLEAFIQ